MIDCMTFKLCGAEIFYFVVLLAPNRYRLNEEKAEWIIYVTDVGQQQHFDMVFRVCVLSNSCSDMIYYPRMFFP